jgi:hypothetical protein
MGVNLRQDTADAQPVLDASYANHRATDCGRVAYVHLGKGGGGMGGATCACRDYKGRDALSTDIVVDSDAPYNANEGGEG